MAAVDSQMRSLGLNYKRFSAVDVACPNAQIAKVNTTRFILSQKKQPVRAELACASSHMAVWQQFLETGNPYALILEDDVQIGPEILGIMRKIVFLDKFDFLNLSICVPYRVNKSDLETLLKLGQTQRPLVFSRHSRKNWQKIGWRKKWRIFRLHSAPGGLVACECDPAPALSSGYIISRKAAARFLSTAGRLSFPIDLTWRVSGGKLVQGFMASPVVLQTEEDSDINGRFDQPGITLGYRLLRPLFKSRRLRRRLDVLKMYGLLRH